MIKSLSGWSLFSLHSMYYVHAVLMNRLLITSHTFTRSNRKRCPSSCDCPVFFLPSCQTDAVPCFTRGIAVGLHVAFHKILLYTWKETDIHLVLNMCVQNGKCGESCQLLKRNKPIWFDVCNGAQIFFNVNVIYFTSESHQEAQSRLIWG